MDKCSTEKCEPVTHAEDIKKNLFEILERMKYSNCDISSIDLFNLVQNSDFDFLQFSNRSTFQFGASSENEGNSGNSKKITGDIADSLCVYQKFTLFEIEKFIILNTLDKCSWNKKAAAKLLGIDRTTIYRKIKKLGITKPD